MKCPVCGGSHLDYKQTITFSPGRTADVYVCRDCGCAVRDYR